MLLPLAVLVWLGTCLGALQFGPAIPPFELKYLGERGGGPSFSDTGMDGLVDVAPDRATVILFKGGFAFGGTAAVGAALDQAPGVTTMAFDSPGGRIGVAAGIAELIRTRHLATAVTRYCASACTVAFVAGEPRIAGRSADFRFHLGSAPVLSGLLAQAVITIEQPWFVRAHVSLAFANRALHAPNEQPYGPRLDELVAAGYVQGIIPPLDGNGPEEGLAALRPLLAAVEALEPTTRRALGWEHGRRLAAGMPAASSADFVDLWTGLVVNRWLGRSSDQAALGLVDALVAIMDATGRSDPAECMRWQVGVQHQIAGFEAIPTGLRDRLRQAELAVLRDARSHPNPVPTERDTLSQADQTVRQAVKDEFGPRALIIAATPEHAFDDPAKSCAAEAAYLRGLRNQPGAGRLIRWALAAG